VFEKSVKIIVQIVNNRNPRFHPGYYYSHIPAFDLTTHVLGIDGAKAAAIDLMKLWIEEKEASNDSIVIN
jgi:hypothetical protein